jgi:uncharacterized glyoxalase superfamily protein PhnB
MTDAHAPDIVPYLSYRDAAAAVDHLVGAFGLLVVQRRDEDGTLLHAELRHGNGVVMIGTDDRPKGSPGIYLVVGDVVAHHDRALRAGAEEVYPPERTEWGTWRWRAKDVEGHEWTFGTYVPSTVAPDWA